MKGKNWGLILGLIIMVTILPGIAKAQNQTTVQNKQIIFIEDDFNEALKQAAAQNKYLFVDAYASWCGPCKMLKSTTFRVQIGPVDGSSCHQATQQHLAGEPAGYIEIADSYAHSEFCLADRRSSSSSASAATVAASWTCLRDPHVPDP